MAVKDGVSTEKARLTEKKRTYLCVKRVQDFILSAIALAVVIDDPQGGPVFSQIRCGKEGKPFRLYKFRTMCVDAEARLTELLPYNEMDGPAFKIHNDPRITRFGRFLRSAGLDELPNWSIF